MESDSLDRTRQPHFSPPAKQVIEVFCSGALSHVDTFDYKPELIRYHGQPLPGQERLISFQGPNGNLTQPLWEFRPRGQCQKMVSDLLPHIGTMADDICFLHSLTNKSNTHGPAENVMNTGFAFDGFPSKGAWINYALGSLGQNLPAFVAIEDPRGMPQSGPNNWAHGFLPAAFQGTPFSSTKPIRHLQPPPDTTHSQNRAAGRTLAMLERENQQRFPGDQELAARLASYQLAARMQLSVPEVANLKDEPPHIRRLYGADSSNREKAAFAENCILARRLVEGGVRFVQIFNGAYASGQVGTYGRDHNPYGFTCWLAGGGVKAGYSYGATDEFGFKAQENVLTPHDFHATILHLLGLDHEALTFYHNGIQRRLTDVHGQVIQEILA